jgi:26S proteasome regulatory subunit T6
MLREELQLLQEQGSLVGEVVKAMDKKKVLVKVNQNFLLEKKNKSF